MLDKLNQSSAAPTSLSAPQPLAATVGTSAPTMPRIAQPVIAYVIANFAEAITLEDLARTARLTRFTFCRRFHRECGVPPMRWLWNFRTLLAGEFINLCPAWSLTEVAFACGFTSSAHFSRSFKAMFGQSPSQFRREAMADGRASATRRPMTILGTEQTDVVRRAIQASLKR